MSYRHSEHCDHCGMQLSGLDGDGDYFCSGLRLKLYGVSDDKTELPGFVRVSVNHPIQIAIHEHVRRDAGAIGYKAMGMVLPGLVCGPVCFKEWMIAHVLAVVEQATPQGCTGDAK